MRKNQWKKNPKEEEFKEKERTALSKEETEEIDRYAQRLIDERKHHKPISISSWCNSHYVSLSQARKILRANNYPFFR